MKITPKQHIYSPLNNIFFGRGGLNSWLIFKALTVGNTSDWEKFIQNNTISDLNNVDYTRDSQLGLIDSYTLYKYLQNIKDGENQVFTDNTLKQLQYNTQHTGGTNNLNYSGLDLGDIKFDKNNVSNQYKNELAAMHNQQWFKDMTNDLTATDSPILNLWITDTDKYLPDNHGLRLTGKSSVTTGKNAFNIEGKTYNSIPEYLNLSRGDTDPYGVHNSHYLNVRKVYYYKDAEGNKHYLSDSGNFETGETARYIDKQGNITEETEVKPPAQAQTTTTPDVLTPPPATGDTGAKNDIDKSIYVSHGDDEQPKNLGISWWDKLRNGINESLPTLMDIGLLWNTLRNNNKNRRDLLKAWHPTLLNTYERYSPVTGSYAEMALYNQMAAETNRRADRNATADAQLNLANRLESNRLANLYREKGFLADNALIEKTALAALGRLEDNMARRADIANKNAASINETNRERALIKVSNRQANTDTLNNFFKNTLNRKDTREEKEEYRRDKLLTNLMNNWYQNQLNNLDAAWEEYATGKGWNPYNSTLKSQDPLYRAFLLTINENAAALSNMQLLGYFPLSSNLSHFNPYLDFTFKDSTTESKRLGGKINRLLRGGGFSQFFTVALFQSPSYSAPKEKAASTSTSKKDDLGLTDIMSLLKSANMLPNEERELLELLQGDLTIAKLTGQGISNIASRYVLWIGEIHNGNFNKTLWSEAKRQAEKNDALNDLSILPNGNIIVLSTEDGELHTLTPAEYALTKGTGLFVSITNDQLLWLRSLDPNYINNNNVFLIINNGIGLKTIYKMIKDNINLAIEESTSESFYRKPGLTEDVKKGLLDLVALGGAEGVRAQQMLMREYNLEQGPNGVYKITDKDKGVNGDKLQAALHYIWSMLPANAKSRLIAETSSGSEKEALTLIALYMIAGLPTETSETYDYLKEAGMHGGTGAGSGSDGDVKTTRGLLAIFRLGETGLLQFNFGSSGTLNVIATRIPNSSISGRNLTNATMQEFLLSELGLVVKSNGASIGGKEINASTFPYIIMKGNDVFVCKFPAVPGKNGEPVPNITAVDLENIKKADEEVRKLGVDITNPDSIKEHYLEVNDIYRRYNLPEAYGSDGLLSSGWAEFVIADIYFDKSTMDIDELSRHPLVRKIGGNEETNITNAVNLGIYNSNLADSGYFKKGNIYEGLLWMPLNTNLISAARDNEKASNIHDLNVQGQATEILNAARRSVVDGSKNLNE